MPLLQVFRMTAEQGDSRRAPQRQDDSGARVLTGIRSLGGGTDERALRTALSIDLGNLLNSINLSSSLDLSAYPAVRRSVLNYGIDDLISLTTGSTALSDVAEALRQALLAHEPRLVPGTLTVTRRDTAEETDQRIAFQVVAELRCRPVDLPLEFVAEIDVGSGKLDLKEGLGGQPPDTLTRTG
ncbi:MAG: type VI secretion system baseplate subunit TssE [Pararhodobacter sp.]